MNALKLAHEINIKLSQKVKYSFMKPNMVLSIMIYYSGRGLLDNRDHDT